MANRLFDRNAAQTIPPEAIPVRLVLSTYTFDHVPEPMRFLSAVRDVLDLERGLLVLEVHDLEKIIERREFCLFQHQHTGYYAASTIQTVVDRAGFRLLEVGLLPEAERRSNSLLVVAAPEESRYAPRFMSRLAPGQLAEVRHYQAFGKLVRASLAKLRDYVQRCRAAGVRLAGYGAGGRGAMTLAACAQPGDFAYVVDKNPALHGRFMPVSHAPVCGLDQLFSQPVDRLIVFSYGYLDEIGRELAEVRKRGTAFVSLLDLLR